MQEIGICRSAHEEDGVIEFMVEEKAGRIIGREWDSSLFDVGPQNGRLAVDYLEPDIFLLFDAGYVVDQKTSISELLPEPPVPSSQARQ